jgi:hypothetical protein
MSLLPLLAALAAATVAPAGSPSLELDRLALADAARRDGTVRIEDVDLGRDRTVDLVIERFEIVGPATRFVTARGAPLQRPAVTLFRGRVAGMPQSSVYLALTPRGGTGLIELGPDRPRFALSGPTGGGADPPPGHAHLAIFESTGGIGPLLGVPVCGLDDAPAAPRPPARAVGGLGPAQSLQQVELAVETDYELYSLFGDADAAAAYIVELYGAVSAIYMRDVNARVDLAFVRIWDEPDDPYDAPDPLGSFVDYWNQNMGGVDRDAAQLLTGRRNLPYGGVAYLPGTCGDFAYSVTGYIVGAFPSLDAPSTGHWDVIVTAHELGHNCGGPHTHDVGIDNCAGGDLQRGTILSYCHTTPGGNANIDLRFHTAIQQLIVAHLTSEDCIADDCNGNGVDDASDIGLGGSLDLNGNGVPDECEDCNGNGTLDSADIAGGDSLDLNGNGVPDECEPDCNDNDVPDDLDILNGTSVDAYGNGVPDECEADCNGDMTPDYNEIQADMSLDLDRNAVRDDCQDCDGDGITDQEALAGAHDLWLAGLAANALARMHASTGVLVQTAESGHVSGPWDVRIRADGHVLVSSSADDRVAEFDAGGAYVGDLVTAGAGGLQQPAGLLLTGQGTLLVASVATNSVLEYDAVTGAALGAFVTAGDGGLAQPVSLTWGPDGNLFVGSLDDQVRGYDGDGGAYVGTLVGAGSGGLQDPLGLVFKPDGNLLVTSYSSNEILEYDGVTGAPLGRWDHGGLSTGFWALQAPTALRLGPTGNVYVTSGIGNAAVHMYDVDTGAFMRTYYVLEAAGPIGSPTGFDFVDGSGIDCNLNLVPDGCDIDSGYSRDGNANGIPDECDLPGDLDGDGAVGVTDFLQLLADWGPCPGPCPPACLGDLDGDCTVGVTDFLLLLAFWT